MTPTTTATTSAPLTLWLTDRTRFKLGTARCRRARYLGYHAGPTGYGLTARRESLPLVTGVSVHRGLEGFARILAADDRLPDLAETRAIVAAVTAEYLTRVEARGYRGILGGTQTEDTITEQSALIAGLLWVLRVKILPWLHASYRVIVVEDERLHLLHCDCGAPPLDASEHLRRRCGGRALMIRTDLLAERRGGSTLAYFECKTTGWESDAWAEQWETDPQLALGTLDTVARYGREVTELYILGLNKGRRQRDRFAVDDERKKQLSPLCYGYRRPGNPPLAPEDWLPAYEWVSEDGEIKRASRAHKRTGIWELAGSDWPVWQAYQASNPGLTPEEFWVRMLPASVLDRIGFVLGPMNRQDAQLTMLRRGIDGDEARWQADLWGLYELQAAGYAWASELFQAALDVRIPCSWACRPFGKEHQCEFVPICHRHAGWDDPIGSGQYQPRLPHHDPELQQAIARGLLPAEAATVDDDEE
jgi:hypothetical protein